MAQDINKHLERARRSLEKNKLREAVTEYQAVLEEAPANRKRCRRSPTSIRG